MILSCFWVLIMFQLIDNLFYESRQLNCQVKSKFYGTHPDWKLTMPSFEKVTKSFGLDYYKLKTKSDLQKNLKKILNLKKPTVCELIVDENQDSLFKQGYKSNNDGTFSPQPLSEMYPFLDKYIANTNN